MTTTPVNRDSEDEPDARDLADVVQHPRTGENWRVKARRILRPLALITLGSFAVALYFFIMAVLSFLGGTYTLTITYGITAVVLTVLGPFIVYKGLS